MNASNEYFLFFFRPKKENQKRAAVAKSPLVWNRDIVTVAVCYFIGQFNRMAFGSKSLNLMTLGFNARQLKLVPDCHGRPYSLPAKTPVYILHVIPPAIHSLVFPTFVPEEVAENPESRQHRN